jgi:transposase
MSNAITMVVGLDLGDRRSAWCAVDGERGEVLGRGSVRMERRFVSAWLAQLRERGRARVVMETGTHSPWVCRLVEDGGHDVVVADARRVRLISQSVRKTDRRDAELLALLGRSELRLLSPIRPRGEQAQLHRGLLRARDVLVRNRTAAVSSARGLAKSSGYRVKTCSTESFPKTARGTLPAELLEVLGPLLESIEQMSAAIRTYDRRIEQVSREQYPVTHLLQQVAGVGPLTALAFVLTIDDPARFEKSREVGAYLGLVPRLDQSGQRDPRLGIHKAGDAVTRRLLVTAAHYILGPLCRQDSDLRRWGLALIEGAEDERRGRKRAVVAVARKLAVVLHRMWVTGECFVPLGHGRVAA